MPFLLPVYTPRFQKVRPFFILGGKNGQIGLIYTVHFPICACFALFLMPQMLFSIFSMSPQNLHIVFLQIFAHRFSSVYIFHPAGLPSSSGSFTIPCPHRRAYIFSPFFHRSFHRLIVSGQRLGSDEKPSSKNYSSRRRTAPFSPSQARQEQRDAFSVSPSVSSRENNPENTPARPATAFFLLCFKHRKQVYVHFSFLLFFFSSCGTGP